VSAGVRVADLLDIGVIAVLLYLGLKWLRRRASRSLAVGIGVLALLYLAAGRLDMVLTSMLFQLGFTAVLFSLIVVFQHDIRRAFERLSSWSLMPNKRPPGSETPELDVLSESIAVMAQRRIGALLVFQGREPIERHGFEISPGKRSRSCWPWYCGCCLPTRSKPSNGRTSYPSNTAMPPQDI